MYYSEKKASLLAWIIYFCVAVVTFIGCVVSKLDDITTIVFFFFFLSIIAVRCCHTLFYKKRYDNAKFMKKIRCREPLNFFDDFFVNLHISICWLFIILTFAVVFVGSLVMFVRNGIYDNMLACSICTYWPGAIIINLMFYSYTVGEKFNENAFPLVYLYGTSITCLVSLLFAWWRMTPFVSEHMFIRILVALLYYAVVFTISYLIPRFGFMDDILEEFGAEGVSALKDFSIREIIDDIRGSGFSGSSGGGFSGSYNGGYSSSLSGIETPQIGRAHV